ncbi:MAG: phosphatase PAP2 family protein [Nitrospira sp.]|nr:phosphatase PAP2 family protein [Nitrospira sp.]
MSTERDAEDFSTERDSLGPGNDRPRWQGGKLLVSIACSLAALGMSFAGLSQFDLPIIRYVRSVTISSGGEHLAIPWMAFTSNAGDYIGEGTHLVVFSLVLAAAGWLWSKETVKRAGIETLLAHGLAAVIANGLKHLVGRPRPKFTHSGDWVVAPSLASGFDSFPSGHSAISFAVATVLAKRFPVIGPFALAVACFVVVGRVLRGSHFPTDVWGAAVIGVVSGAVVAAPSKQWRISLVQGLLHSAWGSCGALALLWALARPAEGGIASAAMIILGLTVTAGGLWVRRAAWRGDDAVRVSTGSLHVIVCGLAALTTSFYVVAAAGLTCLAHWTCEGAGEGETKTVRSFPRSVRESLLLVGVLTVALMLVSARGVLPFR